LEVALNTPQQHQPESGSFRDREGRVYLHGQRVFRGLSDTALGHHRTLVETPFYRSFSESGQLVQTWEIAPADNPLPADVQGQWAGFLEHQRIPVVSYPYEWSFSMLKDAALLTLDVISAALNANWTLKDATPYNVQFIGRKAVFIDMASFEPLKAGEPWVGRRQFCEMFLFPLMLQAYKNVPFQPLMRGAIDGIPVQMANGMFSLRDRLRRGVAGNVWLQAKLDSRYANTDSDVRAELKNAGFNKELIKANVNKLRKTVEKLEWSGAGSEWGDYASFHNYTGEDHRQKERFVEHTVAQLQPGLVWDIGANTGQFSRVAARHAEQVVASDIDPLAVEQMYRDEELPKNILPLVQNVVDPSPDWGWRNQERLDLTRRAKPDLVLCLALIHHVVITANVPLAEFIEWLASLAPGMVIEYVSRQDDKVIKLLRNKDDRYQDYSRENLEAQLKKHYDIEQTQDLRDGARTLYSCKLKNS